jgi:hypothetical protein
VEKCALSRFRRKLAVCFFWSLRFMRKQHPASEMLLGATIQNQSVITVTLRELLRA